MESYDSRGNGENFEEAEGENDEENEDQEEIGELDPSQDEIISKSRNVLNIFRI